MDLPQCNKTDRGSIAWLQTRPATTTTRLTTSTADKLNGMIHSRASAIMTRENTRLFGRPLTLPLEAMEVTKTSFAR